MELVVDMRGLGILGCLKMEMGFWILCERYLLRKALSLIGFHIV